MIKIRLERTCFGISYISSYDAGNPICNSMYVDFFPTIILIIRGMELYQENGNQCSLDMNLYKRRANLFNSGIDSYHYQHTWSISFDDFNWSSLLLFFLSAQSKGLSSFFSLFSVCGYLTTTQSCRVRVQFSDSISKSPSRFDCMRHAGDD